MLSPLRQNRIRQVEGSLRGVLGGGKGLCCYDTAAQWSILWDRMLSRCSDDVTCLRQVSLATQRESKVKVETSYVQEEVNDGTCAAPNSCLRSSCQVISSVKSFLPQSAFPLCWDDEVPMRHPSAINTRVLCMQGGDSRSFVQ